MGVLLFLFSFLHLHANMIIADLTCEMQRSPLALETTTPRFGWKLLSDLQGARQTAYRIVVSSSEKLVWDSGKKLSDQSQLIPFGGKNLLPTTRYTWKVQVWDADGNFSEKESFFETAPTFSTNTKWIGAITPEEAQLPIGRRDFHAPSLRNEQQRATFEAISPLALSSIYLRRPFLINKPIEKAMAYVSGLGHYRFSLN